MLKIEFADEGQDVLWWKVDNDGVVQEANLQNWMWKGYRVIGTLYKGEARLFGTPHDHYLGDTKPGDLLIIVPKKKGFASSFKHTVVKVTHSRRQREVQHKA